MGPVLGIVGWSGSGKTTLLEVLVRRLSDAGLRVNVVKHSHHDIVVEPPHKDSARLRTAGAAEVMTVSPYRIVQVQELRAQPEPPLRELLGRFHAADLTLVEGYKWEAMPKLEVFRPAVGQGALYPEDVNIVAVASDVPPPPDLRPGLAWLDLNEPQKVLDWLHATLKFAPQPP